MIPRNCSIAKGFGYLGVETDVESLNSQWTFLIGSGLEDPFQLCSAKMMMVVIQLKDLVIVVMILMRFIFRDTGSMHIILLASGMNRK